MFQFKRILFAALAAATGAAAQPALTTIQDILYRTDGTRFTGTLSISYNSPSAGGGGGIATSNVTLAIVNGALRVSLTPSTPTPGAQYTVKYNGNGRSSFTETWAVPPSSKVLKVSNVRIAPGSVTSPPAVTTPIQISDVQADPSNGLPNSLTTELANRPTKGIGFGTGRTAIINQSGQLDAAVGSLTDCVRVDGSSGPCGSGSSVPTAFMDNEILQDAPDGMRTTFALRFAPFPAASLSLYRNGIHLQPNLDYTLSGATITFFVLSTPAANDRLLASYRYASSTVDPNSALANQQTVCSAAGSATPSSSLGTCTIPAGVLGTGDRLDIRFQYMHSGTGSPFSIAVSAGGVSLLQRSPIAATESVLAGSISLTIGASNQLYETRSYGTLSQTLTPLQVTVGSPLSLPMAAPLTLNFQGNLLGGGGDVLTLFSFTVIRYPAQSNP
jgi:hypothetical protein